MKSLALVAVLSGCMGELPWGPDSSNDGAGPFGPSGDYTTTGALPQASFGFRRGIDDNTGPAFGIAVGGHDIVDFDPNGAGSVTETTAGPFTLATHAYGYAEVIATDVGDGYLELQSSYAAGVTKADEYLSGAAIAVIAASIPRYTPYAAEPTTFLGPSLEGDVHLFDADGKDLIDTSMTFSGPNVVAHSWDTYLLFAGATHIDVSGPAVGFVSLPVTVITAMDHVELVDSGAHPPADYDHTVCAHGMTSAGDEVAATWTFTHAGEYSIGMTTTNCLEVIPGDTGTTTVTAVASDGTTATISLTP
jgi:hypothetical protein